MKHYLSKLRPRGGSIGAWLSYWFIPAFGFVGLLFAVLAAFLLFLNEPQYRITPTADNLQTFAMMSFIQWLFYSILLWIGLGIISRLVERIICYYAKHHTKV